MPRWIATEQYAESYHLDRDCGQLTKVDPDGIEPLPADVPTSRTCCRYCDPSVDVDTGGTDGVYPAATRDALLSASPEDLGLSPTGDRRTP
jgi:hypothetical protein